MPTEAIVFIIFDVYLRFVQNASGKTLCDFFYLLNSLNACSSLRAFRGQIIMTVSSALIQTRITLCNRFLQKPLRATASTRQRQLRLKLYLSVVVVSRVSVCLLVSDSSTSRNTKKDTHTNYRRLSLQRTNLLIPSRA